MSRLLRKFLIASLLIASLVGFLFSPQVLARRRSRNSGANSILNNFSFSSMDVTYRLSKDSEGRSVMRVREELIAIFPEYDQNHGIERAIPKFYNGHKVFYGDISVSRNGEPENIASISNENDNVVFKIGNENIFVRGEQKYSIEYTLRDVIKDSGEYQELYWNVNGNHWYQRFDLVRGKVIFDDSVSNIYNGEIACFAGSYGSNYSCYEKNMNESGTEFSFVETSILPRSGLTFSIKLKKDSFKPYVMSSTDKIVDIVSALISFVSVALLLVAFCLLFVYGRSKKTKNAIIPQYIPPKGIDLFQSSIIIKKQTKLSSLIIDLAVNNKIKIIENKKKGIFGDKKEYCVELITFDGVKGFQKELMNIFFRGNRKIFPVKNLSTEGVGLGMVRQTMYSSFRRNKNYYSSRSKLNMLTAFSGISILLAGLAFAMRFGFDLIPITNPLTIFTTAIGFVGGLFLMIIIASISPLNERGAEKKAYLEGLKMYIELAESERLKVLQGVDGAERIDVNDKVQRIKLYEKLLPYAIMFGLEKSWMKVLDKEMGDYRPEWYSGSDVVNTIVISSAINSFSSSVNSYSASTGASGSSFGGGGFSGGGGGGGGGGGW